MDKITISEIWSKSKRNFTYGKDFIESETDEYLVICPFNYYVIQSINDTLNWHQCNYHFMHCVCHTFNAFIYWYKGLYQDGRIKAFFFKKDIDLSKYVWNENNEKMLKPLDEFTGWIDFSDRNFLHFAHAIDNNLLTGEYYNFKYEYAYNRTVKKENRKFVDEINAITSQVYDDIFKQYDQYIDELENTLHNIIDD